MRVVNWDKTVVVGLKSVRITLLFDIVMFNNLFDMTSMFVISLVINIFMFLFLLLLATTIGFVGTGHLKSLRVRINGCHFGLTKSVGDSYFENNNIITLFQTNLFKTGLLNSIGARSL